LRKKKGEVKKTRWGKKEGDENRRETADVFFETYIWIDLAQERRVYRRPAVPFLRMTKKTAGNRREGRQEK